MTLDKLINEILSAIPGVRPVSTHTLTADIFALDKRNPIF